MKPDYVDAHCNLGTTLFDQKNFDDAIPCFQAALEFDPELGEAHYCLVLTGHAGTWTRRLRRFEKPSNSEPDYAWSHNNLGAALQGPEIQAVMGVLPQGTRIESG